MPRSDWALLLLLSLVASMPDARAAASELPRNKFDVGRQMIYRRAEPPREEVDDKGNKVVTNSTSDWTITVVDRNDDGSFRLVYQEVGLFTRSGGSQPVRRERLQNGIFDLDADGRLVDRDYPITDDVPFDLFPLLPPSEASLAASWSQSIRLDDTVRIFSLVGGAAANSRTCSIHEESCDNFCRIDDRVTERRIDFDLDRGLTTKVTAESTWKAGADRDAIASTEVIELVSVRQMDDAELATFRKEATRYFAAVARADAEIDLADTEPGSAAEHVERARAILRRLEGTFTVPSVAAMLAAKRERFTRDAAFAIENGTRQAGLLGQPSPAWSTTDLDGKPHSLDEYRGRVVLLDFWYRGCGWCITAMPEIKKLVDDFRDQPVTVLGMNHNANVEDGRRVVDRLQLNYLSLRDGEDDQAISKKYQIRGWPTLIVLDQHGTIRHFHSGYTHTMRHDLGKFIRELLAEQSIAR